MFSTLINAAGFTLSFLAYILALVKLSESNDWMSTLIWACTIVVACNQIFKWHDRISLKEEEHEGS